ncbi:hypothetical protein EHS25_001630 [Saitozyma podzolica]|uniref:Uncharacterized protein n=1 Tax=Saitozyma podzolica TaxID=1890683 RepID=A0A427YGQ5_9TREE|nr:hypothetical protein EHS25_001630 [Saitozyma podzolica]
MSAMTSQEDHAQVQELLEQFRETEVSMQTMHRLEGPGGVSRIFDLENIDENPFTSISVLSSLAGDYGKVLFQDATQRGSTYRMKLVIDYLALSDADLTVLNRVCSADDRERNAIASFMGSLRRNGVAPTMTFVGNSFASGGNSTISNQLVKGALFASHIELRRRAQLSGSQAETSSSSETVQGASSSNTQDADTEVSSGDQEGTVGSASEALRSITSRLETLLRGARSIIDSTRQNDGGDGAQGSNE